MTIEGIGVFGPLEPMDDQVGQRGGDDLVADLEGITVAIMFRRVWTG